MGVGGGGAEETREGKPDAGGDLMFVDVLEGLRFCLSEIMPDFLHF